MTEDQVQRRLDEALARLQKMRVAEKKLAAKPLSAEYRHLEQGFPGLVNQTAATVISVLIQIYPACLARLSLTLKSALDRRDGLCPKCGKLEITSTEDVCELCAAERQQRDKDDEQTLRDYGIDPETLG